MIRSVIDAKTNGQLLRAVQPLWFPNYRTEAWEDVTFGEGNWWTQIPPPRHIADLAAPDGLSISGRTSELVLPNGGIVPAVTWVMPITAQDYRRMGWDDGVLDGIFADPPYDPPGGRGTSTVKRMHEAYGMAGMPATPKGTFLDHRRLIMEAGRVVKPNGRLVFKCADFITSGKYWSGLSNVQAFAPLAGWRVEDIVVHNSGPGPQPKSRMVKCPECGGVGNAADSEAPCPDCEGTGKVEKVTEQVHSRRVHSYLILLVRETWR